VKLDINAHAHQGTFGRFQAYRANMPAVSDFTLCYESTGFPIKVSHSVTV